MIIIIVIMTIIIIIIWSNSIYLKIISFTSVVFTELQLMTNICNFNNISTIPSVKDAKSRQPLSSTFI